RGVGHRDGFFFSSRRRHTRSYGDWSSDVCSSDLMESGKVVEDNSWDPVWEVATSRDSAGWTAELRIPFSQLRFRARREQSWGMRSEERRVGKECRSRGSPHQ